MLASREPHFRLWLKVLPLNLGYSFRFYLVIFFRKKWQENETIKMLGKAEGLPTKGGNEDEIHPSISFFVLSFNFCIYHLGKTFACWSLS